MKESIVDFLKSVVEDMGNQNPKVPVSAMRIEATNIEGNLFAPDWFQYMIYGRGPGKRPPFEKPNDVIAKWIGRNPQVLASAKVRWPYITESGLAFLIGRKIGNEGTRIWRGEAKGVDILGAMERHLPELRSKLVDEEKDRIQTSLSKAI